MSQGIEALRRRVEAAFAKRDHPGAGRVALRREDCAAYEGHDVERFFGTKDWRDVRWDAMRSDPTLDPNAFLFFFTPEGFDYYLPALLRDALDLDDALDLASALSFALTDPGESSTPELREHFRSKIEALSPEERLVVTEVLEQLVREWERRGYVGRGPREALDSSWCRGSRTPASRGRNER